MSNNIIIESLDYFFERREEFKNSRFNITDEISDLMPVAILHNNLNKTAKKMRYNMIGTINKHTNIFTWAWHLNIDKQKYIKTKQLLIYGINKDIRTLQDTFIKRILTESSMELSLINMTLIISIALYLTKAHAMFTDINTNNDEINIYGLYDIDDLSV